MEAEKFSLFGVRRPLSSHSHLRGAEFFFSSPNNILGGQVKSRKCVFQQAKNCAALPGATEISLFIELVSQFLRCKVKPIVGNVILVVRKFGRLENFLPS